MNILAYYYYFFVMYQMASITSYGDNHKHKAISSAEHKLCFYERRLLQRKSRYFVFLNYRVISHPRLSRTKMLVFTNYIFSLRGPQRQTSRTTCGPRTIV